MATKKKKIRRPAGDSAELNIMPFIDIFSMLNTFLLVSASFIGLGILEVQVPFLSNSPDVKEAPERSFEIRVDVEVDKVILTTQFTSEPIQKRVEEYTLEDADIERFHRDMIQLRNDQPDSDKVTVYADDPVKYESVIAVIDAIKTLKEGDPPLTLPIRQSESESQVADGVGDRTLYQKVVMGSVIL